MRKIGYRLLVSKSCIIKSHLTPELEKWKIGKIPSSIDAEKEEKQAGKTLKKSWIHTEDAAYRRSLHVVVLVFPNHSFAFIHYSREQPEWASFSSSSFWRQA